MKRIFIALNVEPEQTLLDALSSLKFRLRDERIKWTSLENIHITLSFLGDTEEKNIRIISEMLGGKCSGFEEFTFTLKVTGVFRNYNDPRVIWAGIAPPDDLRQLNKLIITGLKDSGIAAGDQPFNPHLTLGRIKEIKNKDMFKTAVEEYQETIFQRIHVREVVLYESILLPTGPVYKVLGKHRLKTNAK